MKTLKRLVNWFKSLFQAEDIEICSTKIIRRQLQKIDKEEL